MSGTSLDGVDLVYLILVRDSTWNFQVLSTQTVPYSHAWKNRLAQAMSLNQEQLETLNTEYTQLLAQIINDFVSKNNSTNLVAVCSHGHTIYHDPAQGKTLQIGNLPALASLVKQRVVCDFRTQDVKLGGQGAPLVPIGDALLFSQYTHCLNLGGFANISFDQNQRRVAYDICPVNVVLNRYALSLGMDYDAGGAFAKAGKVHSRVLKKLNDLPFYKQPYPKSLGMEWVNQNIWQLLDVITGTNDKLATFVEHVAIQITKQFNDEATVLITGGGAYNAFLIARLQKHSKAQFVIPNANITEFKEAIIFALLGVLKLRNEPNCLASVTGAPHNHSSGVIYPYEEIVK